MPMWSPQPTPRQQPLQAPPDDFNAYRQRLAMGLQQSGPSPAQAVTNSVDQAKTLGYFDTPNAAASSATPGPPLNLAAVGGLPSPSEAVPTSVAALQPPSFGDHPYDEVIFGGLI